MGFGSIMIKNDPIPRIFMTGNPSVLSNGGLWDHHQSLHEMSKDGRKKVPYKIKRLQVYNIASNI